MLTFADTGYPERLLEIPDPPLVIYVRGALDLRHRWSVAVVGTRRPTVNGRSLAHRLAFELAEEGWIVVSGLAMGIDTAAHEGALHAGGRTVAVLPGGLNQVYPRENVNLAERIVDRGALVSESAPDTRAVAGRFPARNRLISAFSLGCVIVEAPKRSGALITARFALENNREVFAVPGAPYLPQAQGCNALLQDGANWVFRASDVTRVLTPIAGEPAPAQCAPSRRNGRPAAGEADACRTASLGAWPKPKEDRLSGSVPPANTPESERVLTALKAGAATLDEVGQKAGFSPSEAAVQLSLLELYGKVTARGGRYYIVAGR